MLTWPAPHRWDRGWTSDTVRVPFNHRGYVVTKPGWLDGDRIRLLVELHHFHRTHDNIPVRAANVWSERKQGDEYSGSELGPRLVELRPYPTIMLLKIDLATTSPHHGKS